MALKPQLGLFSTTLYGIGIILGAGVYTLIGVGAGLAGNSLWLAFLISALIAIFTGLSYAELSTLFPKSAAEYNYTKAAFKKEWFSFLIQWIFIIGTIVSAAAVALGFAGYFTHTFGGDPLIVAIGLIVAMSILNYIGIKESASFNNFASILEVGGLLIVVAIWLFFPVQTPQNLLEFPTNGWTGIIAAVGVVFFAYIGFENIANLAEEVKDSKKTIPTALILSLAISTVLYMLISVASISVVGSEKLSTSSAPLTDVVTTVFPNQGYLFSLIALFATSNTVLVMLITSSRILYGLSNGGSLPKSLSQISSRGTPFLAVILVGVLTIAILFIGDLKTVVQLTDMGIFIAYAAVNAALIVLAKKSHDRGFVSPRVFGVPILAWLGVITSLFMLTHFELQIWIFQAVVVIIGVLIYFFNKK